MTDFNRKVLVQIQQVLAREKSVLLLGPRQVGKTTIVREFVHPDITISFAQLEMKLRYEKSPVQFERDLTYQISHGNKKLLIFIDEVQKVPAVMDSIQYFIDEKKAQFILSGSSARKLKHGPNINLLPGRVVNVMMDPLTYEELPKEAQKLELLLTYGSLPGIIVESEAIKEQDLFNYVSTYIEEEVRQEALVRNVGAFSQFLELAAIESGHAINFTKIAQDVGVSDQTIKEYFQILEDCLIVFKIRPITNSSSRRVLLKAPKYLFFDLGVRRLAAHEGRHVSIRDKAHWFEQYVGLELMRLIHMKQPLYTLHYWRSYSGVEVDYVINTGDHYVPLEVKWSEAPQEKDARHLIKFIEEYANCNEGYIICRTPTPYQIAKNITVLPWHMLGSVISS